MSGEQAAYEPRDVKTRLVFGVGIGIILLLVLLLAGLRVVLRSSGYEDGARISASPPEREKTFPEPRLQAYPRADGTAFHAREAEVLGRYRWTDSARQTAEIPIPRAMEILAAQNTVVE